MKKLIAVVVCVVVIGIAARAQGFGNGPNPQEVTSRPSDAGAVQVEDMDWLEHATSLAQLTKEAAVIAYALPNGPEYVLKRFQDGLLVMGQDFTLKDVWKGNLHEGDAVRVVRTDIDRRGQPGVTLISSQPGPFETQTGYVLFLKPSNSYAGFYVYGGFQGRVRLRGDVASYEFNDRLMAGLSGLSRDQIKTDLIKLLRP